MTILIRHATLSDLPTIQAIADSTYGIYVASMGQKPGPMLADYGLHLAQDVVLAAVDSDGVVRGYAVILELPDGFWLDNIAVDSVMQGQGVGSALIEAVESWLGRRTDHYRLYT